MPESQTGRLLQEQISYYRARAKEYDEWWLRQGRYDHGPELNRRWFAQAREVCEALRAFAPEGRVLELACGTGVWTEQLIEFAEQVTAVDASREMLGIARARVGESKVHYVQTDIFSWSPAAFHDVVFFSFWLSHVPPESFGSFWELVRACLAPGGRVFFIDSLYTETSSAVDHQQGAAEAVSVRRRLNDGREFRVFKVFYRPDELVAMLAELGWAVTVRHTATHFLYGFGAPMRS
jgi:2-polyprenyl-3-methyl-5-hydroxy-6-metoxy-1,4-benzoquinol methylase